jgi:membrane-bound acyltransferase YfiQ involved in biofilm formation
MLFLALIFVLILATMVYMVTAVDPPSEQPEFSPVSVNTNIAGRIWNLYFYLFKRILF